MLEGPPGAWGKAEQEGRFMGLIVWLIIGGIVGWLASLIMRTDSQQGIVLNIVVGIVGALIAGLFIAGGIPADPLALDNILWSLVGAVVLLVGVNLIRRATGR
jgi:uncharacterized membrane protein YeaQ/YmgE (transglycosylase-associated protein family)